jgi:hypothetical protein
MANKQCQSPRHLTGITGSRLVMNHWKTVQWPACKEKEKGATGAEDCALYHQMALMTAEEGGILFDSCHIMISMNLKIQHA